MSKLLIVVDMQWDFVYGSLGTKEAQAIVPFVIEKIKKTYSVITLFPYYPQKERIINDTKKYIS